MLLEVVVSDEKVKRVGRGLTWGGAAMAGREGREEEGTELSKGGFRCFSLFSFGGDQQKESVTVGMLV